MRLLHTEAEEDSVLMDGGDSDGELTEIRQARLASRKAIDMLMADIKRKKNLPIWVPGGNQSQQFHSNATTPSAFSKVDMIKKYRKGARN